MKSGKDLALVLSGGGARAAYQVGFLQVLARHFPELKFPILTGVSAGAINAAFLANHPGSFADAVNELACLWSNLTLEKVFRSDTMNLASMALRWSMSIALGGHGPTVRGLVDTTPLQQFLEESLRAEHGRLTGIGENLRQGKLKALAITGTDYATGQAVTWVQGKQIAMWERPHRSSRDTDISVTHIMASAAMPIFFPSVKVEQSWYGDGGIRQSAPLSPALHLGARKILAISTRYLPPQEQPVSPVILGYPPLVQILGTMMNAVFLDVLDKDARTLEMINSLLKEIPSAGQSGPVPVELFMLRPSADIGRLSGDFEAQLPKMLRYLGRGLGTNRTKSPDWLSMVLFEPRYLRTLLALGNADAESSIDEISALLHDA